MRFLTRRTRGESHRKIEPPRSAQPGSAKKKKMTSRPCRWIAPSPSLPAEKVVVSALASLRKGGVVAINAIHLDQMPAFDYDKLLWGERQIRSVANMTRQDARLSEDRS
jgi:propanol-preferring alcohol dehydrogenase